MNLTASVKKELKAMDTAKADLATAKHQFSGIQAQIATAEAACSKAKGACIESNSKANLKAYTTLSNDVKALAELLEPIQGKVKIAGESVKQRKDALKKAVDEALYYERKEYERRAMDALKQAFVIESEYIDAAMKEIKKIGVHGGGGIDGIFSHQPGLPSCEAKRAIFTFFQTEPEFYAAAAAEVACIPE